MSTIFITAADARQNPIRDTVVHAEARAIESAILDAVRNGYYQAVLSDGSPMTSGATVNVAIESIDTDSDQIYIPNHPFRNSDLVTVSSNQTLPAPLQANTYYSVIYVDRDHIKLSAKPMAAADPRPSTVDFTAGVYSIDVVDPGSGYLTVPVVTIDPSPTGDNATATATLAPWGSIDNLLIVTPGQGYTAAPTVAVNAQGAGATVGTVEFKVVSVSVADGGNNYRVGDILSVVGGTGTAATATVSSTTAGGSVATVSLGLPGKYTSLPSLSSAGTVVQPGGGTGCTLNLNMGIGKIDVDNGGTLYTAPPRVIIDNGGGANAQATALINAGVVIGFEVTNAGSGYTSVPDITLTTGSGADARAVLVPTGVGVITVTDNGGNTYTEPPTVSLIPQGAGVTVDTVTMLITRAVLTNSGRNYQSGDTLLIAGGAGTSNASILVTRVGSQGEILNYSLITSGDYTLLPYMINNLVLGGSGTTATFDLTAGVKSISILASGTGYTAPPVVTINSVNNQGSGATAIAVLDLDTVGEISVIAPGSGYTQVPQVIISSGDAATATAKLTATSVANLVLDTPGSGYTTASVRIVGDGNSATGFAVISGGSILGVSIDVNGDGYTVAPQVIIEGDGFGATAHAILSPTSVESITVVEPGFNFTSAPAVVVDGAAQATANLKPTGVARIEIVDNGQNYVGQPSVSFIDSPNQIGSTIPPAASVIIGYSVDRINIVKGGSGYSSAPLVRISSAQGLDAATATAESAIGAGLISGTAVVSLYPASRDYWKVWKNQSPSDTAYTRPYVERMDAVANYFISLGYTINRQTNPATGNTIQWSVMW